MRHARLAAAGMLVAAGVAWSGVRAGTANHDVHVTDAVFDRVTPVLAAGLAGLDSALSQLDAALARGDTSEVRRTFRYARSMYKRIELFTEYYAPHEVRELNGVPLPKAEDEDPETPLAPVGLQAVEAVLYPTMNATRFGEARRLVHYMRSAARAMRIRGTDTMPGDAYVFDAMRHEVARVSALGIAGFDATLSGDAIRESADALEGIGRALAPFRQALGERSPAMHATLSGELSAAVESLRASPDFESFDRAAFIAERAVPLARALLDAQRALGVVAAPKPRAWSSRAASMFDANAFDPLFFASTDAPPPAPALISLGAVLFFDPILSPSRTRSCASCHQPGRAFADGQRRPTLVSAHATKRPARNTPTLLNAALQPTLFADGRVRTLEDQASDVIGSSSEMGGTLEQAAQALRGMPAYRERFAQVFHVAESSAINSRTLRLAVAAYVRSLVSLNAPFDRAMRGERDALTAQQRIGFNLFMGKARCGTCHFAPLFHGAAPPSFIESEPEVLGVPLRVGAERSVVDPDSGRFNVRRIDLHLHAFKTPTLRNITLTAPYMHNGSFTTLESIIDFYDAGGGEALGLHLPNQTLPPDSLHLSRREKRAIVSFLHSLTDTSVVEKR